MVNIIFINQFLMIFIISSIWIIPGIIFTFATNIKYKKRQKNRQSKKISKLYPK